MSEIYYFLKLFKCFVFNGWTGVLHFYNADTCVNSINDFVKSINKYDLQVVLYWFFTEDKFVALNKYCKYFGFEVDDIE